MIKRVFRNVLFLAAALVASGGVFAQAPAARNVLEQVNVSASGDQVLVRLTFANAVTAPPPGFALAKPARVALDFTAVDVGLPKNSVAVNQSYLKTVNVAQAGDRTRVVFNLDRPASYQTRMDGKDLIVVLNAAPAIDLATEGQPKTFAAPEPTVAGATMIRDVGFRRGKDGEARVLVDLADASAGIDIRKQGGSLLIEFSRVDIPASLLRKLDVTDFATPVTAVTTARQGTDRVRMTVAAKGNWEHIAYQADNQFVVELRALKEDASKLGDGVGRYTGERLSLRFRDYPVKEVLQAFSDFADFNIVISEAVGGTISLNLQDVPWDQALDIILQQKNLAMRKQGNVMMIAPREEIIARNKVVNEAVELEIPQDAIFQVKYLSADVAKKKIEEYVKFDPQQNKGFKIMAEPGSNKLFVKASESLLGAIDRVLREIDVPPRQVMIEARIVEANEGFSQNLGARIGFVANNITTGPRTTSADVDGGFNVALPSAAGKLNFLLANASQTRSIEMELSALELDGNGKVVSSPRVLATNGQAAMIEDGQEIPYLQSTSSGATSVAFKKATLSLDVTPTINADGRVGLDIKVNKDSPGQTVSAGVGNAVAINKKQVTTKVVVDNGGTVVIGGIYTETERQDETGVPLLRDIPVIGWLFKSRTTQRARTELMVFITPRIVTEQLTLQ